MRPGQQGLTLIELLVALALTALLGVLLAALINGWVNVRERLSERSATTPVLDFCLALERRFDSAVLRQLYEQRLPLDVAWLDWQADALQLQWVALGNWPSAQGGARLQRQRLVYDRRSERLLLQTSADLYAASNPTWVLREQLSAVRAPSFSFRQADRWLAWPSTDNLRQDRGVRLSFEQDGAPYVCTFAMPWGRL